MAETLDDGSGGVQALANFLDGLKGTIDRSSNLSVDVQKLLGAFLHEFEQSNDGPAWTKLQSNQEFVNTWKKFDDQFCDLMIKVDDAQEAIESGASKDLGEAKQEAIALKPLIDAVKAGLP